MRHATTKIAAALAMVASLALPAATAAPAFASSQAQLSSQLLRQTQVGPAKEWVRGTSEGDGGDSGCLANLPPGGTARVSVSYSNKQKDMSISEEIDRYRSVKTAEATYETTARTVAACEQFKLSGFIFTVSGLKPLAIAGVKTSYRFRLSGSKPGAKYVAKFDYTMFAKGRSLVFCEVTYPGIGTQSTLLDVAALTIQGQLWERAVKDLRNP